MNDFAERAFVWGMCSTILPAYIQWFESEQGCRCNPILRRIVERIEEWATVGIHCSPAVVVRIIREYASWETL